jgi:anti-sigma factor RsiW
VTRNCPKENILNAYLAEALSAFRMRRVRKHLQACENCRRKLSDLAGQYDRQSEQMDKMIRSLPEISPSPGFDAAFWCKVAELERDRSRPKWFERFFLEWRFALAAAATVGLVAAVVILRPHYPAPTAEEIFIADHMEMLNEFDLIERLDLLENREAIQAMKEEG